MRRVPRSGSCDSNLCSVCAHLRDRFRFFNCELFFSDEDLDKLESILRYDILSPFYPQNWPENSFSSFMHVQDRVTFFESSLRLRSFDKLMINTSFYGPSSSCFLTFRLRRRQRHQWIDTPLIRILSPSADFEHTRAIAKVHLPLNSFQKLKHLVAKFVILWF